MVTVGAKGTGLPEVFSMGEGACAIAARRRALGIHSRSGIAPIQTWYTAKDSNLEPAD